MCKREKLTRKQDPTEEKEKRGKGRTKMWYVEKKDKMNQGKDNRRRERKRERKRGKGRKEVR